ncbi:MAG: hypothetical protein AAF757_02420 [Cyanobacteria bacterium P01_D01_bin.116]
MAEIELQTSREKVADEGNLALAYKSYRSVLSRYAVQEREPTLRNFLLLLDVIGCSLEELLSTVKQARAVTLKRNKVVNNSSDRNKFSEEEKLIAHKNGFICLEVHVTSIYFSENVLHGSKRFRIKSLKDDLKEIKELDYYKFIREGDKKDIKFDCSDYCSNGVTAEQVNRESADENFVNVEFKEALKEGQEIEFTVGFSVEGLVTKDSTFHYTWVRFPTRSLTMTVTPPNPLVGKSAEVFEYTNKRTDSKLPKGVRKSIGNLQLDEALIFKWEISYPPLYHAYEINWETNSDLD